MKMTSLNTILFVFIAVSGYYQYFMYGTPPEQSLWVGIGFTLILALYLYMLKKRRG